jgi:CxxC motif-containing protein (DUF1111 family)
MNKLLIGAAAGVAGIALVFWILTIPATVPASELPLYTPNVDNGRTMFDVGGCASCHATPNNNAKKSTTRGLAAALLCLRRSALFLFPIFRRMRPMESARGAKRTSSRRFGRGLREEAGICFRHFPTLHTST